MTTKRVIFTQANGIVAVLIPMNEAIAKRMASGLTENEAIEDIKTKDVPSDASDTEIVEASEIPSREFRNAWKKPELGSIIINMPKARAIQARKISVARKKATIVLQARVDEATLESRTADATKAANDKAAVEGLNLATLATQIAAAPNPTVLSAIWPPELQEFRP